MISFRDKTFCPFYATCATPCHRSLTLEVKVAAVKWWGSEEAPVARYTEKPECWESAGEAS